MIREDFAVREQKDKLLQHGCESLGLQTRKDFCAES